MNQSTNLILEIVTELCNKYPVKYTCGISYFYNSGDLNQLWYLDRKKYCYLLFEGHDCVYCGISKLIRHRILSHRKDKIFDGIVLLEFVDSLYWRKSEKIIIKTLMPIYNNLHNPNKLTKEIEKIK